MAWPPQATQTLRDPRRGSGGLVFALCALFAAASTGAQLRGAPAFAGLGAGDGGELVLAIDTLGVATGDLDGDGRRDWLASLPAGGVLVRSAAGEPLSALAGELTFGALAVIEAAAGRPGRIAAALDRGGIVILDAAGRVESVFPAGDVFRSLAVTDLEGDGRPELIAARAGGGVVALSADGEIELLSAVEASAVAAGDFLGGGKTTFALATRAGVLFVDADGTPFGAAGVGEVSALAKLPSEDGGADLVAALSASGALMLIVPSGEIVEALDPAEAELRIEFPFVAALPVPPEGPAFLRGDANDDGEVDLADAVAILSDLFRGLSAKARCRDALDVNDDGEIDISDPIYALSFLFVGGAVIPPPYPDAGPDPTADELPCP